MKLQLAYSSSGGSNFVYFKRERIPRLYAISLSGIITWCMPAPLLFFFFSFLSDIIIEIN